MFLRAGMNRSFDWVHRLQNGTGKTINLISVDAVRNIFDKTQPNNIPNCIEMFIWMLALKGVAGNLALERTFILIKRLQSFQSAEQFVSRFPLRIFCYVITFCLKLPWLCWFIFITRSNLLLFWDNDYAFKEIEILRNWANVWPNNYLEIQDLNQLKTFFISNKLLLLWFQSSDLLSLEVLRLKFFHKRISQKYRIS